MVAKKFRIRFCEFVGQTNRLSFKRRKVLFKRRLWEELTKLFAQHDIQVLVEGDKSVIKCGVVKRREAKTIARIQTLGRKFTPWLNVTRDEQSRDVDAADAAANVVSIENRLSEELLTTTSFARRFNFCRTARRHDLHFATRKEVHFFAFIFRK